MDLTLLLAVGLIILGFLLILVEIFLIPGLNIFGIIGFFAIIAGFVFSLQLGLVYAIPIFIGSIALGIFLVQQIMRTRAWDKIILHDEERSEEGYLSADANLERLVGQTGYALTALRPSGTAVIEGQRVDVVTEGIFIEKDAPVKVVNVEGTRVVVRPAY
ncbi:MAG: hypothetical protein D6675_06370 [Gemmatimonadetes bacterium]|nr:MAG: hypothetical protein D6675_06370 [Gemmatimonadota bacterium]